MSRRTRLYKTNANEAWYEAPLTRKTRLSTISSKRPMFGWLVGSKRLDPYTALTCLKFNNLSLNRTSEVLNVLLVLGPSAIYHKLMRTIRAPSKPFLDLDKKDL